ncbi:Transcription factor iws1, partial [Mortierella sp. NVP41]
MASNKIWTHRPRALTTKDGNQTAEEEEGKQGAAGAAGKVYFRFPCFTKRPAYGGNETPEGADKDGGTKPSNFTKLITKPHPAQSAPVATEGLELSAESLQQRLQKHDKDFDMAVQSGKSTSHQRKRCDEDIDIRLEESVALFVAQMRKAAVTDIMAKLTREVPRKKHDMLETVKVQLKEFHIQNGFLDNGILGTMKLLLETLQDVPQSSLNLSIQTDHLLKSGIGRAVFFYRKVDEARARLAIKRKAQALVEKWTLPILKRSQGYKSKKIHYAEVIHESTRKRSRFDISVETVSSDESAQLTKRVRLPPSNTNDFILMPKSSMSTTRELRENSQQQLR